MKRWHFYIWSAVVIGQICGLGIHYYKFHFFGRQTVELVAVSVALLIVNFWSSRRPNTEEREREHQNSLRIT